MNTPKNLGLCLFLTAFLCGPCSGAGEAPAPAVTAAQLTGLSKAAEQELRGDILPWWLKNARDRGHGGFHSFIGEDMTVRDDLPHGALLTSRILWTSGRDRPRPGMLPAGPQLRRLAPAPRAVRHDRHPDLRRRRPV